MTGRPSTTRGAWAAGLAALTIILVADRVAKAVVREHITPGERIDVLPGLELVHTTNTGIAFGMFAGRAQLVGLITALALCGIAVALVRAARGAPLVLLGGGMLVGGAIGNLVDRLTRDGVTDFIAVTTHWPPFNIADIGIVCGAIIAALGLLRAERN